MIEIDGYKFQSKAKTPKQRDMEEQFFRYCVAVREVGLRRMVALIEFIAIQRDMPEARRRRRKDWRQ